MSFTIVLPTKNEKQIIKETLERLSKLYNNIEILVVDDSDDETPLIVKRLMKKMKNIRLIKGENGLSGSILKGIKNASYEKIIVLDADLQHPPNKIIQIVKKLDKHDIVIGVGNRECFSFFRKLVAYVAKKLANISLFLRGKRMSKDPMSGFFGLKKSIIKEIDEKKIVKNGWKILFDIIKQKNFDIDYFYFEFGLRYKGFSKLTFKEVILTLISFIT